MKKEVEAACLSAMQVIRGQLVPDLKFVAKLQISDNDEERLQQAKELESAYRAILGELQQAAENIKETAPHFSRDAAKILLPAAYFIEVTVAQYQGFLAANQLNVAPTNDTGVNHDGRKRTKRI